VWFRELASTMAKRSGTVARAYTASPQRVRRPVPGRRTEAAVLGRLAAAQGVLLVVIVAAMAQGSGSWTDAANIIVPIGMFVSLLFGAYKVIRADELSIWTPIPWYLGACALYYGLGPLAYPFGTASLRSYMDARFRVSDSALLNTNLLNVVGVGTTVAFAAVVFAILNKPKAFSVRSEGKGVQLGVVVLLLLGVGLPVKYGLALPYRFGLLSWTLPGVVLSLDQLVGISLIPLSLLAWKGKKHWTILWLIVALSELGTALLQFSKWAVVQAVIYIFLGIYLRKRSWRVMAVGGLVSILVIFVLAGFTLAVRGALSDVTGIFYKGTIGQRVSAITEVWEGDVSSSYALTTREVFQGRICYVPDQVFAMDRYESGSGGDSLRMVLYALIPRFIWPEKPIISSTATEYNRLMTGSGGSANGPGVYGEFFWNFGWIGVVMAALFLSIAFAMLNTYSRAVLTESQLSLLPVVIMGITMGYRIDGWFATDYSNMIPIMIAYHIIISTLRRMRT
jgi:hypothetical protein